MEGFTYLALSIFGVMAALLACAAGFVAFMGSRLGERPLEAGIRIWEGGTGSGKSYGVTENIISLVRGARRPIVTNVPLKFRSIRKYLGRVGGETAVGYVSPLSEQHFKAFIARFAGLVRHCEKRETEGVTRRHAEREYLGEHGPHVSRPYSRDEWVLHRSRAGVDDHDALDEFGVLPRDGSGKLRPNWIDYGSVIVIDEVHKWFDQRTQADEDKRLLDFLSMHRHGLYLVEVMTQDAMQVSLSFRRLTQYYIRCTNMAQLPFLFGFRFPLPAFRYWMIPAAALENQSQRTSVKPMRSWMRFPWLTTGLIWRLYASHTHCGTARQLRRVVESSRANVEGARYDPNYTKKRKAMLKKRRSIAFGVVKYAAIAAAIVLAWRLGGSPASADADAVVSPAAPAPAATPPTASVPAPVPTAAPATASPRPDADAAGLLPSLPGPAERDSLLSRFGLGRDGVPGSGLRSSAASRSVSLAAIGKDYVVVGGRIVGIGETYDGSKLVACDVRRSISLWSDPGPEEELRPWYLGGRRELAGPPRGVPSSDPPPESPPPAPDGRPVAGAAPDEPTRESGRSIRLLDGRGDSAGYARHGRAGRDAR